MQVELEGGSACPLHFRLSAGVALGLARLAQQLSDACFSPLRLGARFTRVVLGLLQPREQLALIRRPPRVEGILASDEVLLLAELRCELLCRRTKVVDLGLHRTTLRLVHFDDLKTSAVGC